MSTSTLTHSDLNVNNPAYNLNNSLFNFEDLNYFQNIPWCAKFLNDPTHVIEMDFSRIIKRPGEHSFMGHTLKNDKTISACLCFHKISSPFDPPTKAAHMLVALEGGLDGYPGICHGGMVAALLDEVLMMGVFHVTGTRALIERTKAKGEPIEWPAMLTAQLSATYLRPVKTGSTVLLSAVLRKEEGKKMWMDATIKDGDGNVLAKGESLFIRGIGKASL